MVQRFHGIDRHKRSSTISVLNREGVEAAFIASCASFSTYIEKLGPEDAVVMEVGMGSFWWADKIESNGASCYVIDPYRFRIIKDSWKKTDKHDSRTMAKALWVQTVSGEFGLPVVWKPTVVIRELRKLFAQYMDLNVHLCMLKNRVQSLAVENGITLTLMQKKESVLEQHIERAARYEGRRPLEPEGPKRLADSDRARFREGYQSGDGMVPVQESGNEVSLVVIVRGTSGHCADPSGKPAHLSAPRTRPSTVALPPALHRLPGLLRAALRRYLRQVPAAADHPGRLCLPSLRRLEPGHRSHTVPLLRLRPLPTVLLQELSLVPFVRAEADPPRGRVPQRGPAAHLAPPSVRLDDTLGRQQREALREPQSPSRVPPARPKALCRPGQTDLRHPQALLLPGRRPVAALRHGLEPPDIRRVRRVAPPLALDRARRRLRPPRHLLLHPLGRGSTPPPRGHCGSHRDLAPQCRRPVPREGPAESRFRPKDPRLAALWFLNRE
jgi:hypothetical protein